MHHPWRTVILLWLIALTVGVVALGWMSYQDKTVEQSNVANTLPSNPTPLPSTIEEQLAILNGKVAQLEKQTSSTSGMTASPAPHQNSSQVQQSSNGKAREVFLPLGGGSTNNRDWTTLTAAQITFDPQKFGQIQSVRFEASGSIIGGEVHARLIDITHNTIYYNTELIFNTSSPTWSRSQKFGIPEQPVTYQVQIRSSSGELANLQDSRLVIETKY